MAADVTTLDRWIDSAQHFETHGHRFAYWTDGPADAPWLVFVHGFPTSSWDWRRVWPSITARFRVAALDMLGFGLSDKPARNPYSLKDQATFHEALCQHLGIREAHVFAHDYGDSVAQELLARRLEGSAPVEWRSFVFLNGGMIPSQHKPTAVQRLVAGPLGPLVVRFFTKAKFAKGFRQVFGPNTAPDDAAIDEDWRLITRENGQLRAPKLLSYMQQRRDNEARWVGAIRDADVPIALFDGALDPVSGAHLFRAFEKIAPNATAVLYDHIGHYPQLEDPDAVLRDFHTFFDTQR